MSISRQKRMVVTGNSGQVVTALVERATLTEQFEVIAVGRPKLDLSQPETIEAALRVLEPDIIISAAAYTAVDQAEVDEAVATVINGAAAGAIATAAARLRVPVVHLSTDYVFNGKKASPYHENDTVDPINAYGRSKLTGEREICLATRNHAILRTAWVYSPFGKNFVKTMMSLAETRDILNVVDDQIGNPTSALDIADAVLTVSSNLINSDAENLRGVFHMSGSGEASWADFATEIFARSRTIGGPDTSIFRIASSSYPTLAKRPANSRLDCTKLSSIHGVKLPNWQSSTATVVARLV